MGDKPIRHRTQSHPTVIVPRKIDRRGRFCYDKDDWFCPGVRGVENEAACGVGPCREERGEKCL